MENLNLGGTDLYPGDSRVDYFQIRPNPDWVLNEEHELIEIAPGADLERDILAHMEFTPAVSPDLKEMDARLFRDAPMGLAGSFS